jgi:hypothetical protein
MKKLLLGCAVLALVASVMSVMLWRDLHTERELNAAMQARLSEAEARMAQPMASPPPTARAPATAAAITARPEPAATEARPAPSPQPSIRTSGINERDMLKDPEYRKARLVQIRLQMPERYPGLAEELGLSPEQADRLFDLLAEHQLEMNTGTALIVGANGQIDETQLQERQRLQQELRARQDATLTAMLGDARMDKWREYQQTQGPRQQVMQLGRTLDAMGMPLSAAQRRPLTEAMVAEQTRQRQEQMAMARELAAVGPGAQRDPQTQARLLEESFRRQADSNRRLLDIAAAHLTARQLELYRSQLESQLTVNRVSSRALREAAEQNRTSVSVIVTTPAPLAAPIPAPPAPGSYF